MAAGRFYSINFRSHFVACQAIGSKRALEIQTKVYYGVSYIKAEKVTQVEKYILPDPNFKN